MLSYCGNGGHVCTYSIVETNILTETNLEKSSFAMLKDRQM